MKKDGRTDTWLAEQLGCVKSNISDIYDRQSIDTDLLSRICIYLEVDYLILYSEYIKEQIQKKNNKMIIV